MGFFNKSGTSSHFAKRSSHVKYKITLFFKRPYSCGHLAIGQKDASLFEYIIMYYYPEYSIFCNMSSFYVKNLNVPYKKVVQKICGKRKENCVWIPRTNLEITNMLRKICGSMGYETSRIK